MLRSDVASRAVELRLRQLVGGRHPSQTEVRILSPIAYFEFPGLVEQLFLRSAASGNPGAYHADIAMDDLHEHSVTLRLYSLARQNGKETPTRQPLAVPYSQIREVYPSSKDGRIELILDGTATFRCEGANASWLLMPGPPLAQRPANI